MQIKCTLIGIFLTHQIGNKKKIQKLNNTLCCEAKEIGPGYIVGRI